MKIAVNTRLLLRNKLEGIGWFTLEIFKRLTKKQPEVDWFFLFDRPYDPEFIFEKHITALKAGPPSRHPLLWYWWFEHSVPQLLRKSGADVFISPDGYLPINAPCKTLPVIHDLNFEHQPQNLDWLPRLYMRHFFPRFARKATRIATVSNYSRRDIAKTYQVPERKIDLVYNGIGDFFHPLNLEEQMRERERWTRGKPYFVFIGALNPRKNLAGMLRAFAEYRQSGGENNFVVVGEKMYWTAEQENIIKEHPFREDIIFAGRQEGETLNRILASAKALMFVSHFEGFGIPILEAFKCGVPVITATNSSMPEVAGDAALLCDSNNTSQIADAMRKVDNPELWCRLKTKGQERVREFSWERSASMMWESIQKTLASE